jgi:hypothetical protein
MGVSVRRKIVLVSCVKEKRRGRCKARDLYVSAWFKSARAFVEASSVSWWILSAQHGLLSPRTTVGPYNLTLNTMPASRRRRWADRVWARLRGRVHEGDEVVFLAGARYRENLIDRLETHGCHVRVPMEGLRLGEQLKWLTRRTRSPICG